METIKIGKIVNAVGLKGEVKVYNYSDRRERYEELDRVIVNNKEYEIEKVRYQQEMVILKLKGVDDRDSSEALKTKDVFITEADLRELPEDTFYIRDLIGMEVENIETGEKIGIMKDVLQNTAQDIYVVNTAGGREVLIPAVSEFIKEINPDERKIRVHLIEGMLDEN